MQIRSTVEVKSFWDSFADTYQKYLEKGTTGVYNLLVPLLKLPSATKIVEVGCGAGNGVSILRSKVPDSVEIVANDISELMLEKAIEKNLANVQFNIADNENLPYPDTTFDRYIANLSLHIVADPQKMIEEAFRVLQPGGLAAFSVFGRPKPSNFFDMILRSFDLAGYTPADRSYFHLSDDLSTVNLVQRPGFEKIRSFYSSVGLPLHTVEEAVDAAKCQQNVKELKTISETLYQSFLNFLQVEAEKILSSGLILTFDCLIVIAQKPLQP
jgi:ubiquinone/menaquinone biosynthesis C-methylase UbiE